MQSLIVTFVTFCAGINAVPLEEFYNFGTDAGDSHLPRGDDSLSRVLLNLILFGSTYKRVQV